jgi:signal peptidase I
LSFGGGPDLAPALVPVGRVLVMGDSRGNSRDGRFFGLLPLEEIYARASRVFYRRVDGFVWKPL